MSKDEEIQELKNKIEKLEESELMAWRCLHDYQVSNQSAWIEWQRGRGAEYAMRWIHNGLVGPGLIPDEEAPWANEPQAWFDANQSNPFPMCFCGRPSNQLWMGRGACCDEHMREIRKAGHQEH